MTFLFLLVFIALSYVYPGELFPEIGAYRITYWVAIIGLVISTLWLFFKRRTPLTTPQLWLLGAFALTLGISRMIADRWLGAPIAAIQWFGSSLTMFVLTVCSIDSLRKLRIAIVWVVLLSLTLVGQGVAAYHFGYKPTTFLYDPAARVEDVAQIADRDEEDSGNVPDDERDPDSDEAIAGPVRIRGLGLLHDPNDLAMALVVTLGLLVGLWTPKSRFRNLALIIVPTIALGYGVFLTRSRGGAVAFVVTLWAAFANRVSRITAALLLVAGVSGVLLADFGGGRHVLSPTDESVSLRFVAWTEGLEMLKAQPLLGIGYRQFLEHYTLTAHNAFVLCFAETGLIGFFFWLAMIVVTFVQLGDVKKSTGANAVDNDMRRWATGLQLALIGFLTATFFLSRTYAPILYLILGLSVSLILIARQAHRPISSFSLPRFGSLVLACELASILVIYALVKFHLA